MGITDKYKEYSNFLYYKARNYAKKVYLRRKARQVFKKDISKRYKKEIKAFWGRYQRVTTLFHAVYKQYTGIEDTRFIPDDVFAVVIDGYYNDGAKAAILENKCFFPKMFNNVKQPISLASRVNGIWYIDGKIVEYKEVMNHIKGHSTVIKQACGSSGGHGIFFFGNNDNAAALDAIMEKIKDDIIVQESIKQHPVMASLHKESTNTIRVLTVLSDVDVKIYSCFLRCGIGDNRVDNASLGGLICGIDKNNGHLKKVAYSLEDYSKQYERHPDSRVLFETICVPSWDRVLDMVKAMAIQMPYSKMVAWDIAIDEIGDPVLIEANLNNSLVSAHQLVNGPLFGEDTKKILDEIYKKN